ncbi:MAG: choice-of-anchor L domain-containing protein [Bacteroidota bacterium]|nr:choice-of-anchor L domain-containing protein [Bacteroidota bacterium]
MILKTFIKLFSGLLLLFISCNLFGQLSMMAEKTPSNYVMNVFTGNCSKISNLVFKGDSNMGASSTIGEFNGGNYGIKRFWLGIGHSIFLTTGKVGSITGNNANNDPDNARISTDNHIYSGDPDLDALDPEIAKGNHKSGDATVLEFDFIPQGDSISFRYVFASEEYPNYGTIFDTLGFIYNGYNDLFGMFISGPGITGKKNIALLPDNKTTIGVQNVNQYKNSAYYINSLYKNANPYIQFNGYTTPLVASAKVQPGKKYHLKIAIEDVGIPNPADSTAYREFDSGVFLEANSFQCSNNAVIDTIKTTITTSNPAIDSDPVAGCTDAIITFSHKVSATDRVIKYSLNTTLAKGQDYTLNPDTKDSVIIKANQASTQLTIHPLNNGYGSTQNIVFTIVENDSSYTINIKPNQNIKLYAKPQDNPSVCNGNSINIWVEHTGGFNPLTYKWNNAETTDTIKVKPAIQTTYTVTVTDACNNTATENIVTSILTDNTQSFYVDSICPGVPANLTANGMGAYDWLWDNGKTTQTITVSPKVNTTYNVTVTGTGNCTKVDTFEVYMKPIPKLNVNTLNGNSVCLGDTAGIYVSGGLNYFWTASNGDNSLIGQETFDTIYVSPQESTEYKVISSASNGCRADTSITINIIPGPTAVFSFSPKNVCVGDIVTVQYQGNADNTANYSWNWGGATVVSGTGQGPYSIKCNTPGWQNVTLQVNQNGCKSEFHKDSVFINSNPEIYFLPPINNIGCEPLPVIFSDSIHPYSADYIYNWSFGDGNTSNNEIPTNIYRTPGTYDVSLTVTIGKCKTSDTLKKIVTVYSLPVAKYSTLPPSGQTTIFNPVISFNDVSEGADSIKWVLWDGTERRDRSFTLTFADTGSYYFTLYAYSTHQGSPDIVCTDSVTGVVRVSSDYTIYIPNCFTPNGDGINDIFQISGVGLRGLNITIFNRWGEVVFESSDIQKGWDGKVNGNKAETGVYLYKVEYKDSDLKKQTRYGKVTLIYIE